jgi:hypothetical protein
MRLEGSKASNAWLLRGVDADLDVEWVDNVWAPLTKGVDDSDVDANVVERSSERAVIKLDITNEEANEEVCVPSLLVDGGGLSCVAGNPLLLDSSTKSLPGNEGADAVVSA